jgi:dihydrofolate reductase
VTDSKAARPRISIIVAHSANRVIGASGKMPWHLPDDLKHFKALTMGHSIVMGRKTWESLGRLLPGRRHVVVSRNPGYAVSGATVVSLLDDALLACAGESEIFVIGGGDIYKQVLPKSDRLYITEIDSEYEGDTYFPGLDASCWEESERIPNIDQRSGQRFSFVTLDRIPEHRMRPCAP